MIRATAAEVQNDFSRYLKLAQDGDEIIITENGAEVARLVSREESVSFLSDSLIGILSSDIDGKEARAENMRRQ